MKRYIENNSLVPIIVAGYMIQPGQGRDVDVPEELQSSVPAGSPQDPADPDAPPAINDLLPGAGANDQDNPNNPAWPQKLLDLQALPVAKLKDALDGLTAEELLTLGQIEEAADPPRSTVLEMLAAAQLRLAQKLANGG